MAGTITLICFSIGYALHCEDENKKEINDYYKSKAKKYIISAILYFAVTMPIATLIPSTPQAVTIWLTPKIANDEQIQEIPQKGLDILVQKMDEYLEELDQ
jgi:hypothetical protein